MVIALIGIMAALLAGNAGAFIETAKEEPPARVLRKAVLDATYLASQTKGITYLRFDDENGTLVIENSGGTQIALHRIVELPDELLVGVVDDPAPAVPVECRDQIPDVLGSPARLPLRQTVQIPHPDLVERAEVLEMHTYSPHVRSHALVIEL